MVVIVTGSRKWKNKRMLHTQLTNLNPDVVVHGGAIGADSFVSEWCRSRGRVEIIMYPDYDAYKKRAPLVRNIRMLETWPEATVVACPLPGGSGTQHTMREARKRDMEVCVVPNEQ